MRARGAADLRAAGRPGVGLLARLLARLLAGLLARLLAGLLAAGLLAGCAEGRQPGTDTLDVLAAASLSGAFEEIAEQFEAEHPGVEVRLSIGSSAALARQVLEGAPADVLATADLATMEVAEGGGGVRDPASFATNRMVLVAPVAGPVEIDTIEDLDRGDVTFAACAEPAPCGEVAGRLLTRNRVATPPVSLEPDVRAVLARVLGGEVDAGLVYATDAEEADGEVVTVAVPGSASELNTCALAVTEEADDAALARDWVALVTSARGQRSLREAGFGAPPESS